MEEEWLSIGEVAKRLGLAENTARRYANLFKEYIKSRQFGRATKYHSEALEMLANVSRRYQEGLTTQEIQERLRGTYSMHVDISPQEEKQAPVALAEIREAMLQMAQHIKNQEEFNQELLRRLEERDQNRDQKLMQVLREIREHRLQIAAAAEQQQPKKAWWKWW